MSRLHKYVLSVFMVISCIYLQQCAAQQSSTTVRPYQFGFTIDEQQHRQEKRDERGIVMGEFGFITADGIYHVTVYATDEQGRFRILAMKSYPYESPPKMVEIMLRPKAAPTTTTTTTTPRAELQRHNFYTEACSGCFLSNGKNKPKGQAGETPKTEIRTLSRPLPAAPKTNVKTLNSAAQPKSASGKNAAGKPAFGNAATGSAFQQLGNAPSRSNVNNGQTNTNFAVPQGVRGAFNNNNNGFVSQPKATSLFTSKSPKGHVGVSQTQFSSGVNKQATSHFSNAQTFTGARTIGSTGFNNKQTPYHTAATTVHQVVTTGPTYTQTPKTSHTATHTKNTGNPKSTKTSTGQKDIMDVIFNDVLPAVIGTKGVVSKPPTVNAPSGKVPAKSFVPAAGAGNPGSRNSVSNGKVNPKSTSANAGGGDGDLYRFKYILDYHGHTETGKRNGNKEGNYFAIGDDDIERTIDYVANENGYQPRIHWRKLNQKGSLPKQNTLKDYEFVWFTKNL